MADTTKDTGETTAVATRQSYGVIRQGGTALLEALADNLGGNDALKWSDLTRIKTPSGGGSLWEVPALEGVQPAKSIEGVIVLWRMMRSFFANEDPEEGTPPACSSEDAVFGNGEYGRGSEGNPSGRCATCPMAQWDSGKNGVGQACKQKRVLFLLRETDALPVVVLVGPGSLKTVKSYFMALSSEGLPYYSVVTRLGLQVATSKSGPKYAQIVPQMARRLTPEEIEGARGYNEQLRPVIEGVVRDGAAWDEDEEAS